MRSSPAALLRRAMLLAALLLAWVPGSAAAESVLILGSTVFDPSGVGNPANSLEAKTATALGFTVNIVDDATWQGMTAAQFATYRAIILGDPRCGNVAAVSAATTNAGVWGPLVTGNVIIIGTDPVFHQPPASGNGKILTEKGIAFAVNQVGKTGAYITLSCYYGDPALNPVPLLDKAFGSGPGSFQVRGTGGFNNAHITAIHPVFTSSPALTDADLSNWNYSVHESFDVWPLDFVVLAIARNFGSSYTAPDGTVGTPYILARGEIKVLSNIELLPTSAVNETGTSHTVTATVKDSSGNPLPGVTVTFKILTGPHVGKTATAVTNASGKATFTYTGSATGTDTIQAQFAQDGKTQTSNLAKKEWVTPSNPCMRTLTQKLLCETDSSGHPTGKYTWTFRFQNLSGKPVSHVFFVNPSTGTSLDPTHLVFSPAVTNLSPVQTVTIDGAPGTVQFLFSAHDQSLEECCSMKVTLELPPCDCAQMVQEVTPGCFPFFPPPYKYQFNLQNLSPFTMEHLLIAPVSPADLLTPVAPSQLKVTKDVLSFAPIVTGGKTNIQTLTLTGTDAAPGKKACLRMGIHDDSLDECCSIVRCFTLPSCIIDWDRFDPFGDAEISLLSTGFIIEGIGSSGEDGAGIDLPGALSARLDWLDPDPTRSLPNGAFLEVSAAGTDLHTGGQVEGKIRITDVGSRQEVTADIDGSPTYRAEVFKGSNRVGIVEHLSARIVNVVVIWPISASAEVLHNAKNDGGILGFRLGAGKEVAWELAGGTTLKGDSLLIAPEQPDGELDLIRSFAIRAADIPSITVTGFSASLDCNGNGIPDDQDIASGASLDLNNDGLPDECQGGNGNDLDLPLNTGFDQVSGTPLPLGSLPGGTSDDDWRVVNAPVPGPAKLVIHPTGAWPAPLPSSRWISVDPNSGASVPGRARLQLENCFCLGARATSAELDVRLFADDSAQVFLNGNQIGAPGGGFGNALPLQVQLTGAVGGTGLFKVGENCLRVEVRDTGRAVTGLDLTGTVRSKNGQCADGPAN